jgi:AcrR family transcriptional regulator
VPSSGNEGGLRRQARDKSDRLLEVAARLMARKGYSQTSIRDVAREMGSSLAGMYYYFQSKEELLFQIQNRTFAHVLEEQQRQAMNEGAADERLRRLIASHLSFFTSHADEMKICTFELESLSGELYDTIEELRRRYFQLAAGIVAEIMGLQDRDARVRQRTLFVFGTLNWVFMWYQPERDGSVAALADEMSDFVLHGIREAN